MLNEWNALFMVIRGKKIDLKEVDGLIAYDGEAVVGIITYIIYSNIIEIISLNSFKEKNGVGTFLIQKLKEKAIRENICEIKVITTNDNINAMKFYQKRNFEISNIYVDSMKKARRIKPNIPKNR